MCDKKRQTRLPVRLAAIRMAHLWRAGFGWTSLHASCVLNRKYARPMKREQVGVVC